MKYFSRPHNTFSTLLACIAILSGAGTSAAHAAIDVKVTSTPTGDQASVICMANEANLSNNMTVPVRRGGKNTIRLQETGISEKLTSVSLNNCPSCTATIGRSGDTARVDIDIPASTTVGTGPSVTLRLRGVPDPVINLAVNPGYSVSSNLLPPIGTIRKGDTVTVAGRDLDAGSMKVEPACVALVSRSAASMQLKYNCEVDTGSQGAIAKVKYFHNVAAAQRCELSQDWRIANFDANAKPDLAPVLAGVSSKVFRPLTPGSMDIDAAFCRNLPPASTDCARQQTPDGTFITTNQCTTSLPQGDVLIPELKVDIKNIGTAPATATVAKISDGNGADLGSRNIPSMANGVSTSIVVRAALTVPLIAKGPSGCQVNNTRPMSPVEAMQRSQNPNAPLPNLTVPFNRFDPAVFVIKADATNTVDEGATGKVNNELRF